MARVRSAYVAPDAAPAAPAEAVMAAPAASTAPWPFDPNKGSTVESTAAPVSEASAPAPEAPKQRAKRSDAGKPKPVAPKPADGLLALTINDFDAAVELFKEADPRHRASALDELELRIKVIRTVLGTP